MDKAEAIRLLGGTVVAAAEAVGISPQAISLWPDTLPPRISDRVQAALWRRQQRALAGGAGRAPDESCQQEKAA